jgi:hypothetical protein
MRKILKTFFPEYILDFGLVCVLFSTESIDEDPVFPKNCNTDSKISDTRQIKPYIPKI